MRISKSKLIIFTIISLYIFCTTILAQETTREITSIDFQSQRAKAGGGRVETAKGASQSLSGKKVGAEKNSAKTSPKQQKNIEVVSSKRRKYKLVKRVPQVAKVQNNQNKLQTAKTQNKPLVAEVRKDKNKPKSNKTPESEQLGVTFWRLRPIKNEDGDVPLFPVKNSRESWTAERVASTTRFRKGDRVRFTVESSRTGFLYIVNREIYEDGTTGAAKIIYPTLRTRGGENSVKAGSLVDIPASTDSVPYFTVNPKREDYAGEELFVLITEDKLPLKIGLKPLDLTVAELEKWAEDWSEIVDIYDAEDGEGIAVTETEFNTAKTSNRELEQEEPLPQTIYKVSVNPENPLFVKIRLTAGL